MDPDEVVCVGLGLGAGAGVVGGGASVCVGAGVGAAGGAAPDVGVGVGVLAGAAAAAWCLSLRFLCTGLLVGLGLGLACGDGRTAGLAAAVVWAFAVRANRVANATAVIALSWVARQVRRDRRRMPSSRAAPGVCRPLMGQPHRKLR